MSAILDGSVAGWVYHHDSQAPELSADEKLGLSDLVGLLESTSRRLPPRLVEQFLLSSRNKPQKAAARIKRFLESDASLTLLNASPRDPDVCSELLSGKFFTCGNIVLFRARFHDAKVTTVRQLLRSGWVLLRTMLDADETVVRHGVVFVVDMKHVRMGQLPHAHLRSVVTLLSNRLPLRVLAEVIVDPPLWTRAVLFLARPCLSEKTKSRLGFVARSKLKKQGNSAYVDVRDGTRVLLPTLSRLEDMHGEVTFDAYEFYASLGEKTSRRRIGGPAPQRHHTAPPDERGRTARFGSKPAARYGTAPPEAFSRPPPDAPELARPRPSRPTVSAPLREASRSVAASGHSDNGFSQQREATFFHKMARDKREQVANAERALRDRVANMTADERAKHERSIAARTEHQRQQDRLLKSSHLGHYKSNDAKTIALGGKRGGRGGRRRSRSPARGSGLHRQTIA